MRTTAGPGRRLGPAVVRDRGVAPPIRDARPRVDGKFFFVGGEKLYLRGVTYGPFRPGADGCGYADPAVVERDFIRMAAMGANAVRTYTVPPRWLLDIARRHGLRVMVGLAWEQHVAFLGRGLARDIEGRVRAGVRACAGHPAILAFAVGNEIPAPIVRWYGRRRIAGFIRRLYRAAKAEDPGALVTYVNYPTTEYLRLPFVDFVSFNVYLEARDRLAAYLGRLQTLAGDRPLVMAEIGLDSRGHGEPAQARGLDWQVRTAFAAGSAGCFVFAWTDEWHRGGVDIEEWRFGLTDARRRPKPALAAVRRAFSEIPFPRERPWPRVSVVVCSHNGAGTIRDCCEGLRALIYPDFEVIVVDDGSTDGTGAIASEYGFRVIATENRGLSSARNTGLEAATGEIVAYIDDDARPDTHWLQYLAHAFITTEHAGVGGPNIAPADSGAVAGCVANAPGGPNHVLLSDDVAEHIPGCNMTFRAAALRDVGGFDPRFHIAGDDVDLCWRLQQRGATLGFQPGAMVWHRRRDSVRRYWKQQFSYGRAEGLLERKWPEKYNALGHPTWGGRIYGGGVPTALFARARIYHGVWGSGPFQSIYGPPLTPLHFLPMVPEWHLGILALSVFAALGVLWAPLVLPLLLVSIALPVLQAGLSAARASLARPPRSPLVRAGRWGLTTLLHLIQPMARLFGRFRAALTPWRRNGVRATALPWPRSIALWSETWRAPERWLSALEAALRDAGARVRCGGAFDRWDLEARDGTLASTRILMAIEEHGGGKQLLRFRIRPRLTPAGVFWIALPAALFLGAVLDRAGSAGAVLGLATLFAAGRIAFECATATAAARAAAAVVQRSCSTRS